MNKSAFLGLKDMVLNFLFGQSSQGLYGFGKFWKVTDIENSIFQDLESFREERILKIAMEKFWIFVNKNAKNILKWI